MKQELKNKKFEEICKELRETYNDKNMDYGDSFGRLYDRFGLESAVIRISDKVYRLQTLIKRDRRVADETVDDTLKDLAGYCIMTVLERRLRDEENSR